MTTVIVQKTSEAVLMEFGNILSQIAVREKAFHYLQLLRNDINTEIISIDSGLFEIGPSSVLYSHNAKHQVSQRRC